MRDGPPLIELQPRRILTPLVFHRRWLIGAGAATLFLVLACYVLAPRTFSSVATIEIVAPDANDRDAMPSSGKLAAALLKQRLTAPSLIAEAVGMPVLGRSMSIGPAMTPEQSRTISRVQTKLSVEPNDARGVFSVRYADRDRRLAATVLNDLLRRLVVISHGELHRERVMRRVRLLKAEVNERESALALAQVAATQDAATHAAATAQASSLTAQLAAAKVAKAKADSAAANASRSRNGFESPVLRTLLAEQKAAAAHRAELADRYGPLHPDLIAAEEQLADISLKMSNEISHTAALLSAADAARERLTNAEAALALNQNSVASEQSTTNLKLLAIAADSARTRYQAAAGQLGRVPAAPSINLRLISPARPPERPSAPNPVLFAAAGLLAAALAAAGTLLVRERRQRGFRTVREAEGALGFAVIALVPDVASEASFRRENGRASTIHALYSDPDFAEAFRRLVAGLGVCGEPQGSRSVAVCSALPNEGKTTVSVCLARSAAETGCRVVLVDCDGRRRALSRLIGPQNGGGLVQHLRGDVSLDSVLVRDPSSGVCVIPHSNDERIDTELFASPAIAQALLSELRRRFDLILLDTAPVLALEETRTLAGLVDQVLLVARWRKTPTGATRAARDLLARANAKIAGVAMTMVRFA